MNIVELETGWLSPNGDFYPCAVYEHIICAKKILNDKYATRADEKLQDIGFAEITISQVGIKSGMFIGNTFLQNSKRIF